MSFIDALISELTEASPDKPLHVTIGAGTAGYHICLRPFKIKEGVLAGPSIPEPELMSPAARKATETPVPNDHKIIPTYEQESRLPLLTPEATSPWSTEPEGTPPANETPPTVGEVLPPNFDQGDTAPSQHDTSTKESGDPAESPNSEPDSTTLDTPPPPAPVMGETTSGAPLV